mgnify:CR=1 FL=1
MLAKTTALLLLAISLVGCASVPMGSSTQDAALKKFMPASNQAGIYVYRNENFGAAVKMDVKVDDALLGQTVAKTFLYKEVLPGNHRIASISENTDTVEINAEAGKLYYIWQEVKMGVLYARTKLHLVSDEEGKKGVLETKLAATQ